VLLTDTPWNTWRTRVVYALLFMLPVAGISVRHWISGTFTLLVLLALPDVFRRRYALAAAERYLLLLAAAFFVAFLVSSLANGWTELQTRYLGREIRFLLLIPIYLMVRRYPDAGLWLVRGGVVGGLVLFAQGLYDLHVLKLGRAQGIYSPNLLGPYAAIIAVSLLIFWKLERARRWLRGALVASLIGALAAVMMSGSRGGFVGLFGMLLVWGALSFRGRHFALVLAGIIGLAYAGYTGSDHARQRIDQGMSELIGVIEVGDRLNNNSGLGSVPARAELWRAALLIARDNLLWGVGRGNYTEAARPYIANGEAHPEVVNYEHPHNAYLEVAVSKGLIGLAIFVALLWFPLYRFWRARHAAPEIATLGIAVITGFSLFSLTDASTFIKGNFIAIYLIYLAVLFAWLMSATQRSAR
jgi:O-antigen ligase